MQTIITTRRIAGLIALSMMLVSTMGCNKLLASYSLSTAKKRVAEAKDHMAEKFTGDLLDQVNGKINQAQAQYDSSQFKEARVTSKEAAQVSKELLQRAKTAHATDLQKQASRWLQIARDNQAQNIDNTRFNQIQQDNETGNRLMDKQKYDKSIAVFDKVVKDIDLLLANLRQESLAGLDQSKKFLQELTTEGAPEHAPEFVTQINSLIDQIQTAINKDYKYRVALRLRDQASQTKLEGVTKTKEVKSKKQINEIENLLDTADTLGASIYAGQNWKGNTKEFENMLTQFYEKNYDTVLTTAPQLKPKVEELIVETKRESARAKMQSVEKSIQNLEDRKARSYLPGRVEQLDALLKESSQLFEQGLKEGIKTRDFYTESQKVSTRAQELNQTITQEFDTLALQEINKASESLGKGEGVFTTMQEIFDKPAPGVLNGEDKSLEESKHALKEELRARLKNSQLSLSLASLKREQKEFDVAIETAKQVAQAAEDVRQQTYRVVAHNAILEIANQLTRLEREGGREYAAAETNKTLDLLEKSKGLLRDGQFREAVRQAADTKAQLEILIQELERVAVKHIEEATKALTGAQENRAPKYQREAFDTATVELDRAKASLEGEGLLPAIEAAKRAEALADAATKKSLQQWTEEERRRSDLLLTQARAAGAENYAAERLQKAVDIRKNLEQLYNQGAYKQAIGIGEEAVEAANAALYAPVIDAENAIASAKRFAAWEQEPEKLAQAIVSAKNGREMMDQGQYALALQHAGNAFALANKVSGKAKREAFEVRMDSLQKHMETAQKQGAGYYQTKDLAKILSEMNGLRNEFDQKTYEDLAQKIELLESQLAGVMEMTPDVLKDLVVVMQNRLQSLEERGARKWMPEKIEEVEQKVKYAQLDYKNEKYRPSYVNAKDASGLMDAIETNLAEREFDAALTKELKNFNDLLEKFGPVLNVGSPALIQMAVGPQGRSQAVAIHNAISPTELRTAINEIGARVRLLNPPRARRELLEAALRMLMQAKTAAANFEKMLILDQYQPKEAREIIETAFLQMYQARSQQQQIQHAVTYPTTEIEPAGVERIVSYQGK